MIDLYTSGAKHQNDMMTRISKHLTCENRIKRYNDMWRNTDAKICVAWGVRYLDQLKKLYDKVFVVERGYFNDRLRHFAFGIDGLNGRADFRNESSPPDRWNKHGVDIHPWKHDGDYYLIMGQVNGDMSIHGVNIENWYASIYEELKSRTQKPVYFRPHPLSRASHASLPTLDGELDIQLRRACGVATYNSNSGVDAALAGVPVMAQDEGSMVWDISAHSISELMEFNYPDRAQWVYNLAYTQWTLEEMSDGTAWKHLCY